MGKDDTSPQPEDADEPLVVNGITYANLEELEKRREVDAEALARLLYDIYKKQESSEDVAQ